MTERSPIHLQEDERWDKSLDKFVKSCQWAFCLHRYAKLLYRTEEFSILLNECSRTFFTDIHAVLYEAVVMSLCRLVVDKAETIGKENLSLETIMNFNWSLETKNFYQAKKEELNSLGVVLKDLRDKIIAHNDFKTMLEISPITRANETDIDAGFESINEIVRKLTNELWHREESIKIPHVDLPVTNLLQKLRQGKEDARHLRAIAMRAKDAEI